MIRLIRIFGILLIALGAVVLTSYFIKPLRHIWTWFRTLDWPIQLGLAAAGAGILILTASVIWERWEDWEKERNQGDEI